MLRLESYIVATVLGVVDVGEIARLVLAGPFDYFWQATCDILISLIARNQHALLGGVNLTRHLTLRSVHTGT